MLSELVSQRTHCRQATSSINGHQSPTINKYSFTLLSLRRPLLIVTSRSTRPPGLTQLIPLYLVVGFLTDNSALVIFDRQLFLVVRYRYDFHFDNPSVYKACTFVTSTSVRISPWASTMPVLPHPSSRSLRPVSVGITCPNSDTVGKDPSSLLPCLSPNTHPTTYHPGASRCMLTTPTHLGTHDWQPITLAKVTTTTHDQYSTIPLTELDPPASDGPLGAPMGPLI